MSKCKENLNKLKELCEELNDRDAQLKINSKTLWQVINHVDEAKKILTDGGDQQLAIKKLESISELLSENNCKRII